MTFRRSAVILVAAGLLAVGLGGAALFFWGGKPDPDDGSLRGEVTWESDFRLHGTVIVTADDDHVVIRQSPVGGSAGVDVVAIDLDTGEEVLRDRAQLTSGIGLVDGRLVFVQDDSGDVVSHDLRGGERWTYEGTDVRITATTAGVVLAGTDAAVTVLDPASGGVLWERLDLGRPVLSDAATTLVRRRDGSAVAHDIASGAELWSLDAFTRQVALRSNPAVAAPSFVVHQGEAVVGYEPRSGDVLWEHAIDTGDSSSQFFHAPEENLVIECIAGTTLFTVRTIDDRSGEVLATVTHDPRASLAGYNRIALVIASGESFSSSCISFSFDAASGPLEGYGLRDGRLIWQDDRAAVDLAQPASRGADDRAGAGLRVDVVRRAEWHEGQSTGYFFATTGEEIVVADDASAVDVVAGELVITTTTEETVTVTLTEPEVTVSGSKGIDGTSTVYPVRGGLLVLAGRTLALVR